MQTPGVTAPGLLVDAGAYAHRFEVFAYHLSHGDEIGPPCAHQNLEAGQGLTVFVQTLSARVLLVARCGEGGVGGLSVEFDRHSLGTIGQPLRLLGWNNRARVGGFDHARVSFLGHHVGVDGFGQRLAESHVAKGRFSVVQIQNIAVVDWPPVHVIAALGRKTTLGVGDAHIAKISFTVHQFEQGRIIARRSQPHHRVHVGLAFHPVVGVFEYPQRLLAVAVEGERASRYRLLIGKGDGFLDLLPQVLRHDGYT